MQGRFKLGKGGVLGPVTCGFDQLGDRSTGANTLSAFYPTGVAEPAIQ
jgi:hypothetical protein